MKNIVKTIYVDFVSNKEKHYLFLLEIIMFVGLFFRFYNIPLRYGFDYDATRDALIAIQGARNLEFPLTGADSSVGPFHFGPWYYYFIIIFRILIPWDYAPWLYISILSFLTIPIMYKIGIDLGNKKLGLLLAGLFAISPSQIGPAVGLSNPHVIPFYTTLAILLFIRLAKSSLSVWWALGFGVVLGLGINHHYQMGILLILPILLAFWKKEKRIKYLLATIGGIIITFIPLLLFDVFHNWQTVRGFIYYVLYMRHLTYVPNNWTLYISNFWLPFWSYTVGIAPYLGSLFFVTSLIASFWLIIKNKLQKEYLGIFITFIICFLLLRYYSGERYYYQVLFIQPFIIIISGIFIWSFLEAKKFIKYMGFFLIGVVLYFAIPDDIQRLSPIESHIVSKKEVSILTRLFPQDKFSIYQCGTKEKNKSHAIALLLHSAGKLNNNGTAIGLVNSDCIQAEKADLSINGIAALKLSSTMVKNISVWTPISPQAIYDKNALWWVKK